MTNWKTPVFSCLLIFSGNTFAQEATQHPIFSEDWLIRIGGQRADADVRIGLGNPDLGEISIIDLEAGNSDTSVTSFWTNIIWQGPERWSFGFSYFLAEADTERVTSQDVTYGELEIPAGTGIQGDFNTDFYVLNGFYDFYQTSNAAAGIGIGIYALDLSASVETVVGGDTGGGVRETAEVLAPLPTISGYYKHAFSDKLALRANVAWLSATIDEYDGDVKSANLSIEYWPTENWGFGAGFTYVDIDVEVDKRIFDQTYIIEYDSLFAFMTWGF